MICMELLKECPRVEGIKAMIVMGVNVNIFCNAKLLRKEILVIG